MNDLSRYKLTYELSGSIISFNENDQVGYTGSIIEKELTSNGIDLKKIISSESEDEDGRNLLALVNKVRLNQRTYLFKFNGFKQEFLLMPASIGDTNNVFLTLKNSLDQVSKLERDLNESLKELECLYNVSLELQSSKDIYEAFQKCTEHIKRGFQFPEHASVIIDYNNRKFISQNGSEKSNKNILTDECFFENNRSRGVIKVIYHKKIPFLKEEIELLKEISRKFTKAVEKEERTKFLSSSTIFFIFIEPLKISSTNVGIFSLNI